MKRGMISVFIIVGLILLILLALVLSLYRSAVNPPGNLPKEADSIVLFTRTCMEDVAQNGLDIMGLQGGYINLPRTLDSDPRTYINLGFKVPYWYFNGRSYKPTLDSVALQLESYLNENLPQCLHDYRDLSAFTIVALSNLSSHVEFGDEAVRIRVDYRLKVSQNQKEDFFIDGFNTDFDSKFKKMYNLAKELMQFENTDYFLENYTDEMIACSDYLPYEGMELSCKPKLWLESDMKEYTQTLIMHNLHFLMFEHTDYEETGIPYYDKQYKVDFTDNDYEDMSVEVMYNPSQGMDFHVTPSHNGVVEPFEFKIATYLRSCMKVFHHKYTVEYPVLFQIIDREKGGRFLFATPVMLRRGIPNRYDEVYPWPTDIDNTLSREYCANTSKITIYDTDENNQIIATPSIRSNRLYSLRVFAEDEQTYEKIPGVDISYQCVLFRCPIGKTMYPTQNNLFTGASPVLKDKFPDCFEGVVIGEKKGYQTGRTRISVGPETDQSQVVVPMYPLKQFGYTFKVVEDHNNLISKRDPNPDEYILMTVSNKEESYEESIIYPAEDGFNNLTLMVGDFSYDLDIKLVSDDNFLGGLSYNWSVSRDDVMNRRNIIFYALKKDLPSEPTNPEDYQEILNFTVEYAEQYPPDLR